MLGSAGSPRLVVSMITVGKTDAVQSTLFGSVVSAASAKSHPPAPSEILGGGALENAAAGGAFERGARSREVGIAPKIFPGEAGGVE